MSYPSRPDLPRSYVATPGIVTGSSGLFVGSGVSGQGPGPSTSGMYPRVAHPVGNVPVAAPAMGVGVGSSPATPAAAPFLSSGADIPIKVLVKQQLLIAPMAIGPFPQIPPPRSGAKFDFDFERDFIAQVEREAAAIAAAGAVGGGAGAAGGVGTARGRGSDYATARHPNGPYFDGTTPAGRGDSGRDAVGNAADPVVSELQKQLNLERFGEGNLLPQNGTVQEKQESSVVLDPAAAEYLAMGYPSDVVHLALAVHNGTTQTKVLDFCTAYVQLSEMGFAPEAITGALALYDNDRDKALTHLAGGL